MSLKLLTDDSDDRDVLLAEMQRRMMSNFALISGLLNLRRSAAKSEEARDHLTALLDQINALGIVQQLLTRPDRVSLACFLRASSLYWEAIGTDRDIAIDVRAEDDIHVPEDAAMSLSLVANELVTTAFEHAFRGRSACRIEVRLNRRGDWATLAVVDQGDGIRGAPVGKRLSGSDLVRKLVGNLGGIFEVTADVKGGTRARVAFPISEPKRRAG